MLSARRSEHTFTYTSQKWTISIVVCGASVTTAKKPVVVFGSDGWRRRLRRWSPGIKVKVAQTNQTYYKCMHRCEWKHFMCYINIPTTITTATIQLATGSSRSRCLTLHMHRALNSNTHTIYIHIHTRIHRFYKCYIAMAMCRCTMSNSRQGNNPSWSNLRTQNIGTKRCSQCLRHFSSSLNGVCIVYNFHTTIYGWWSAYYFYVHET